MDHALVHGKGDDETIFVSLLRSSHLRNSGVINVKDDIFQALLGILGDCTKVKFPGKQSRDVVKTARRVRAKRSGKGEDQSDESI